MLEKLRNIIFRILGIKANPQPDAPDAYVRNYEDVTGENITATIANKLGMLTFADSECTIGDAISTANGDAIGSGTQGLGARSQLISAAITPLWSDGPSIAAQVFGKGGKVLVPSVHDGHIDIQPISQNRMIVKRMDGQRIMEASLLLDTCVIDAEGYWLIAHYSVDGSGTQAIRYRACTQGGAEVPLGIIPKWQSIQPDINITGTDRVLFGFLRCPRDNRKDQQIHGVPITYGAERDIAELVEHIAIYRREFKLSRMMLGLDASLWRDFGRGKLDADGVTIADIKRTVQDSESPFIPVESMVIDGKTPWQQYAPNIRIEAMEARYNSLLRRVEKACGLSQGILTDRQQVNYANRDEVRAAQYDTFSIIKAMRQAWETAIQDVAYAIDVLAEFYNLTPSGARGQYEITYDWDTSMIESSTEAFAQMSELQSRGMVSKAELRQWVRGGTLEEAQEAIDEIDASSESQSAIDRILMQNVPDLGGGDE